MIIFGKRRNNEKFEKTHKSTKEDHNIRGIKLAYLVSGRRGQYFPYINKQKIRKKEGNLKVITKMEQMVKEDMAAYILEELSTHGCIPEEKRTTAMNVITKALLDIRRYRMKGDKTKMPDSSEHSQAH